MKKQLLGIIVGCAFTGWATAGVTDWVNGAKVGAPLPSHDLQYLSATPITENKLVLIDFWATWCVPCLQAIPKLNTLHAKYEKHGLAVIGVSQEKKEVVSKLMSKLPEPIQYAHAVEGSPSLHRALRIKALPYAIFVDQTGKIVWRGEPEKITDKLILNLLEKQGNSMPLKSAVRENDQLVRSAKTITTGEQAVVATRSNAQSIDRYFQSNDLSPTQWAEQTE